MSEQLPDDGVVGLLTSVGFERVPVAPRGVTVPFICHVTLVVATEYGDTVWRTLLWLDRVYVATQRIVLDIPGGPRIPCRVIGMDRTGDGGSVLAVWADRKDVVRTVRGAIAGWQHIPDGNVPDAWRDLMRVSEAVEAEVGYLLSTPVVMGVVLHDAQRLHPMDVIEVLPEDVAEGVVDALVDAGMDCLLPE